MIVSGTLKKMNFGNIGDEYNVKPSYILELGASTLELNHSIGKYISLKYLNEIHCIKCGRKTNKSFGQGYCYPCFIAIPETEECVLKPELCRAHEGIARDMEFARKNCLVDHYVYLAWTGGLKVGVTRYHQIPIRWVDQGATLTVKICRTPNRYTAGLIEVELKKIFADKTAWQRMLTDLGEIPINLLTEKAKALEFINGKGYEYIPENDNLYRITYPIAQVASRVKSVNLDKENTVSGVLTGIKGQYMIFDTGRVINIRNHSGYSIEITIAH